MKKVVLFCLLTAVMACKKSGLSDVPKITYISMTPQILVPGSSVGGTRVTLYFEDGDGDIGYGTENLFFKDSRDSSVMPMMIPTIPGEYSPNKGLKGTITIDFLSALLLLRPDTAHINKDTLHWEIFMKDKAGHVSNTVTTDNLYLIK